MMTEDELKKATERGEIYGKQQEKLQGQVDKVLEGFTDLTPSEQACNIGHFAHLAEVQRKVNRSLMWSQLPYLVVDKVAEGVGRAFGDNKELIVEALKVFVETKKRDLH